MKRGETITVGPHVVMAYSITDPRLASEMNGRSYDVLYTDPPWGPSYMKQFATLARKHTGEDFAADPFKDLMSALEGFVRQARQAVYVEMGREYAWMVQEMLSRTWGPVYTRTYRYGSERRPYILSASGEYPVMLPPENLRGQALVNDALSWLPEGSVVFDPCCGTGITARACLKNGLTFIGNELNPVRAQATVDLLRQRGHKRRHA